MVAALRAATLPGGMGDGMTGDANPAQGHRAIA